MDFKALMTKLDTIEKREILTEGEDRPAAKKKETTWTDKSGKKHPATQVQGSKSVAADKEADKERKKHDKELDEMVVTSSIAKELLKEFNIEEGPLDSLKAWHQKNTDDYNRRVAAGEIPPAGYNQETDGPWMGKTQQTNVVSGDGTPVKTGSGGNLVTNTPVAAAGAGTKPAVAGAPGAQDDATGVDAAVAAQQAGGPTDAEIAANNAALGNWTDQPDTTGAGTKPAEPAAEPAKGGINPTVLNRYKELLDKLEGAGKAPAKAPAAPAKKPATGAAAKPAAGGATMPAVDQMGNATGMPGMSDLNVPESVTRLADDQVLAIIKGIRGF